MKEKSNVYLWGVALLAFAGLSYFLYKKTRKIKGSDNFNLLLTNEPTAKILGEIIKLKIDDNTYAQFYKNTRFFIFNTKNNTVLTKGNYYNGGRILESDNSKNTIKGNDVIQNLKDYKA